MVSDSSTPLFSEADLEQVLLEPGLAGIVENWMKMGLFAGTGILLHDINLYMVRRLRQISESRPK